jgi:hypothetical protein
MSDLAHNPYDFANPVSDPALFAGRTKELDEIKYYLYHAKNAPRPINIAIIGSRASGKTSILNMAELHAKSLDFITARVDLDEGDARGELQFFSKLFNSVLTCVCQAGAFGGLKGKTYDVYLDAVNTFDVPDDKTFCPFLFPIQYAKAMAAGRQDAPLSDGSFKIDFLAISKDVGRPIVIFFDECNILSKSRIILEKLRNIFMNLPGYMVFLTGTEELFPLIVDVFSPIMRQFKKISIKTFVENEDTRACIEKPLRKINLDPKKMFDRGTLAQVESGQDN